MGNIAEEGVGIDGNIAQEEVASADNIAQERESGIAGKKDLLPVMVFFHGGGFVSGSGSRLLYGPELLLDKEVLLVFSFEAILCLFGLLETIVFHQIISVIQICLHF